MCNPCRDEGIAKLANRVQKLLRQVTDLHQVAIEAVYFNFMEEATVQTSLREVRKAAAACKQAYTIIEDAEGLLSRMEKMRVPRETLLAAKRGYVQTLDTSETVFELVRKAFAAIRARIIAEGL